jgi:hypothetical protein
MGCYYIRVHFDGPYVSGLIVPEANDEFHALKIVKKALWARIQVLKGKHADRTYEEVSKLKAFLRSLKRPWRYNGGYRKNGEKKAVSHTYDASPMVQITKLQLPVLSDYWLTDLIAGQHYCNLPTTWEPRPRG